VPTTWARLACEEAVLDAEEKRASFRRLVVSFDRAWTPEVYTPELAPNASESTLNHFIRRGDRALRGEDP
jgi:hypothetical protein